MSILLLLADAVPAKTPVPPWYQPSNVIFILVLAMFAFLMMSSSRAKKADAKKRAEMLQNMKRGDRVMTAGGILGTVVDVREKEVVLKVDEGSNTKIRFTRDAIKKVLIDDEIPVIAP